MKYFRKRILPIIKYIPLIITLIGLPGVPEYVTTWISWLKWVTLIPDFILSGLFWVPITILCCHIYYIRKDKLKYKLLYLWNAIRKVEAVLLGVPIKYWFENENGENSEKTTTHLRMRQVTHLDVKNPFAKKNLHDVHDLHIEIPVGGYRLIAQIENAFQRELSINFSHCNESPFGSYYVFILTNSAFEAIIEVRKREGG